MLERVAATLVNLAQPRSLLNSGSVTGPGSGSGVRPGYTPVIKFVARTGDDADLVMNERP